MKNIETPQLLLRHPIEEDAFIIGKLWKNELVRAFLGGIVLDEAIHEKITAIHCHWDQHQFGFFTVIEKNNKEIIGMKHTNSFERFDAIQRKHKVLKNEWLI